MKVRANGIDIEVEDSGADGSQADRPVVLLIMGLGMQLIGWPDDFWQPLVAAGFRVVRHDNRDIGLSEGFDHAPRRNLMWQAFRARVGLAVSTPYTLQDMANDSLGVLDALGIRQAHVIGASMGGMIAQRVAASAPERVLSLTSIMSSSGARGLPGPHPQVAARLMRPLPARTEQALVDYSLGFIRLIESPAYPCEEPMLRQRLTQALRRAYRPSGLMRQMLAIGADADRPQVLAAIRCPTLVLHGEADRLVPIAAGRDTARRISGARFVSIAGMGHDLPPPVNTLLLGHIIPFLRESQERTS
ncbi:alpha/beta hydrolase [Variovorax dokdonensis]|uniref:Alpha/beta hydrolase n=1 Tax=Variovorax dokdonensis TaxID=344883 RepID=A0ABT7N6G8_9BURK|nr:alpha/beta hydrolase [Variovorax dokdonensis]MDM0043502.1 alpha/beta hydrolase [Variovorax dokdonensis]